MNSYRKPFAISGDLRRRGFTLIELLVVITIVIVLAVIVVAITGKVRENAVKIADMQNLRSLATAAMASAGDTAGRLPAIHTGTDGKAQKNNAPYYLVGRNTLESYGIYKEACYIPRRGVLGGAPEYTFWTMFAADHQTPIHYCYFANDAPQGVKPWFEGNTVQKPTEDEYRGATPYQTIIKDPSKAFARNFTDDAWYPVLWAGLARKWQGKPLAAIMKDDKFIGVNIMYLDGSAKWVPIDEKTKPRYKSGSLEVYW